MAGTVIDKVQFFEHKWVDNTEARVRRILKRRSVRPPARRPALDRLLHDLFQVPPHDPDAG